jgi:hypothetical protein
MTLAAALLWMERLVALAIALATLELLSVRRAFADGGVFAWPVLRREFASAPRLVRGLLDATLAERPFQALLALRLLAALVLPFFPHGATGAVLLATTLLVCVRFRGTYNGGSDAMTVIVLLALCVARLDESQVAIQAGLAYAAVQLTLSYFLAGVAKLRASAWRSGRALNAVLLTPPYAGHTRLTSLPRALGAALAWGTIAFECALPLAWLDRRVCIVLLATALLFHVANAFVLGLNRFVWAWLSAYPALLYFSELDL